MKINRPQAKRNNRYHDRAANVHKVMQQTDAALARFGSGWQPSSTQLRFETPAQLIAGALFATAIATAIPRAAASTTIPVSSSAVVRGTAHANNLQSATAASSSTAHNLAAHYVNHKNPDGILKSRKQKKQLLRLQKRTQLKKDITHDVILKRSLRNNQTLPILENPIAFAEALNTTYTELQSTPSALRRVLNAVRQQLEFAGNWTHPAQRVWVTPHNTANIGAAPNQALFPYEQESLSGQLYQRQSGLWTLTRSLPFAPHSPSFLGVRWFFGAVNGFASPMALEPLLSTTASAPFFNGTEIPMRDALLSIDQIDGDFDSLLTLLAKATDYPVRNIFRLNRAAFSDDQISQMQQRFGADRVIVTNEDARYSIVTCADIQDAYSQELFPYVRDSLSAPWNSDDLQLFTECGGRWADLNFQQPSELRKLMMGVADIQFQWNQQCNQTAANDTSHCQDLQILKSTFLRFAEEFGLQPTAQSASFASIFRNSADISEISARQYYVPLLDDEEMFNLGTHRSAELLLLNMFSLIVTALRFQGNSMPEGIKKKIVKLVEFFSFIIKENIFLVSSLDLWARYMLGYKYTLGFLSTAFAGELVVNYYARQSNEVIGVVAPFYATWILTFMRDFGMLDNPSIAQNQIKFSLIIAFLAGIPAGGIGVLTAHCVAPCLHRRYGLFQQIPQVGANPNPNPQPHIAVLPVPAALQDADADEDPEQQEASPDDRETNEEYALLPVGSQP